jgi:site-specific DNA recombinase
MRKARVYLRVSTDKKEADPKKQTTKNQLMDIEKYCQENDIDIIKVYQDKISGRKEIGKRPGLQSLLNDCGKEGDDLVVFWSIDRFCRSGIYVLSEYLSALTRLNIDWMSVREPYLNTLPKNFKPVVVTLLAQIALEESEIKSDRVQSGMRRAKEEGSVFGRKKTIDREKVLWYKERYNYSNKFIAHIMGVSGTAIDKIMNNELDFITDKKLYCRPR